MKRIILLAFFSLVIFKSAAQPAFAWAKSIGNSGSDEYVTGMKIDNNGFIYITGFFSGTLDFNPGTGTNNLTSNGATDIFVAKYSSAGAYLWAIKIGDTGFDEGNDLVIDDSSNIYICGYYNGNPDFDPGPNTRYLGANALNNAYYLKLSSNGTYMSAAGYNSPNYEMARAIAVDAAHNVYVTGSCQALTIGTTPVGTKGGFDVFITRTNANGSLQWVREVGGSGDDNVTSMDIDNVGNLFISGNFFGTDFDANPTAAVYTMSAGGPNSNSFLVSMYITGTFNWGNNWGSNLVDDYGEAVTAASSGETFQAANFGYSIESIAFRDATGAGVWGVPSSGATFLSVQSLDCDASYNVYMAGNLVGSMTWNGPSLGSAGSNDIYVAKWNGLSTQQWQFRLGGVGSDAAYEVAIGPSNTVFIAGIFSGNVDFNPSSATNTLSSVGGTDMFMMRLGATTVGLDDPLFVSNSFYAYPNPATDILTVSFAKTAMIESTLRLFAMDGKCVITKEVLANNDQEYELNVSSLPAGMYILELQQGEKHEQQKIVKFEY
jgi:hypothetical protein